MRSYHGNLEVRSISARQNSQFFSELCECGPARLPTGIGGSSS